MASLYDRLCILGDWETDGGSINPCIFGRALHLYATGVVTASWVKANCMDVTESALTPSQESDMDDLLATIPAVSSSERPAWASKVEAILWSGRETRSGFDTESAIKTALGV